MSGRLTIIGLGPGDDRFITPEASDALVSAEALYGDPKHPYTRALLSAVPRPEPPSQAGRASRRRMLSGEIPSPLSPPSGCKFHPRCPEVMNICSRVEPPLVQIGAGHQVACHLTAPATS